MGSELAAAIETPGARAGAGAAGLAAAARARAPGLARGLGAVLRDLLTGGLADLPGALARARTELVPWSPIALSCGIGAYFAWPGEPGPAVIAAAVAAGLLGLWGALRGAEALRFPAACLFLAALGLVLASHRAQSIAAPVLAYRYYGPVEGRIVEIDRSRADLLRLTLAEPRLDGLGPEQTPARVRISLHKPQDHLALSPGLRVALTANLSPPPAPAAPGAFDFRRFSWFDQLGAVGYTKTPVLALGPPEAGLGSAAERLRLRLSAAMQAAIPGQAGAVAAALMTGDRSGILEQTNAAMRAANLYHIVSISGLHMGLIAGFVFAAIRYGLALAGPFALIWPTKKIAAGVALVAASLYLWISGAEVATQRAYLMTAVMLGAVLFDRRALSLGTVALAAFALLLWRPEVLTSAGFQMSFAATVALIVTYRHWPQLTRALPRWLTPVAGLAMTSLVAGFATGPIAAAQFHRMTEYGLLANMLAVPVVGAVVMPAGVIAAVLAPLGLAAPALWAMGLGTRWMLWVADLIAGLEGATVPVGAPPGWVLPVLALGAVGLILGRGAARGLALAALGAAALGWQMATPPLLLIAPEGELVGLMTPAGRALSKPGAAFIAESWLAADGDGATVEEAAARPGFSGEKAARSASLPGGRTLWHLTGKSAPGRLAEACAPGALVVLAARAPAGFAGPCDLWDQTRLAQTGAVGITADGQMTAVSERTGARLWAPRHD